ncbi:MAG: nucleotidyltransferase family protein, partial [Methylococcales bacterium]|nr:nucleotidyltransferase family protein [Methylococcales bacterium]
LGGDWHHLIPYVHPKHGTTIELHSDLVRRMYKGWALEAIWGRVVKRKLLGRDLLQLHPTDMLIHAVMHARHHLFSKLTTLLDVGLLLDSAGLGEEVTAEAGIAKALLIIKSWLTSNNQLTTHTPTIVKKTPLLPFHSLPLKPKRGSQWRLRELTLLDNSHHQATGLKALIQNQFRNS